MKNALFAFGLVPSLLIAAGCAQPPPPEDLEPTTTTTQALGDTSPRVCAAGATLKGIDVSHYEGHVNWQTAAAGGIAFGIARVSDGTQYPDAYFASNWSAMKAAGVVRGAYQYFEANEDVDAQADMMIAAMATMEPGDLPPTIDVEVTHGLTPSQLAPRIQQWIDRVAAATGRAPMVYTGYYFWRDSVASTGDAGNPLWAAEYTSECPLVSSPWIQWTFWQHSGTGSAPGVSGPVDVDLFNGDLAALQAFANSNGVCGDGVCSASESAASCAIDCEPCQPIANTGGLVDDSSACFDVGGPAAYMRHVTSAGWDNDLYWTHTTAAAAEANFGQWNLRFLAAGSYYVDVYQDDSYSESLQANYRVHHNGIDDSVVIDQTAAGNWLRLGAYDFAAGDAQFVHLGDNTGEASATNTQLVFDAIRVYPVGTQAPMQLGGTDGAYYDPATSTTTTGTAGATGGNLMAGCSASGGSTPWSSVALFLAALAIAAHPRRNRRARPTRVRA